MEIEETTPNSNKSPEQKSNDKKNKLKLSLDSMFNL